MARYRNFDSALSTLAAIWSVFIEAGGNFVLLTPTPANLAAAALYEVGWQIIAETGTTFNAATTEAGSTLSLGTTAGSDVGAITAALFRPDHDPHLYGRVTPPSVTGQEFTFGFNGQAGTNPFATPTNGIYFYSTGTGALQAITRASASQTATTTSVTPDGATEYTLRIEVSGDGTSVAFYVNDTLEATHTTNIPTVTTALNAAVGGQSGGSTDNMWIGTTVGFTTSA